MSDRIVQVTGAVGVLLAAALTSPAVRAASVDSNATPAVCRSGSVSILVGGAGAETLSSACSGFGRQTGSRPSAGAAQASPARREKVAAGSVDEERRAILENELQHEMALLKQSERANTEESKQAAARSRANIEALRREMARSPGPVVR